MHEIIVVDYFSLLLVLLDLNRPSNSQTRSKQSFKSEDVDNDNKRVKNLSRQEL